MQKEVKKKGDDIYFVDDYDDNDDDDNDHRQNIVGSRYSNGLRCSY